MGNRRKPMSQKTKDKISKTKEERYGKSLSEKQYTCSLCGVSFLRKEYDCQAKIYKDRYCSKEHAMIGAARKYRPAQAITFKTNNHIYIRYPAHPKSNKNGQVPLSHIIIERNIGRCLKDDEIVHHKDCDPLNNSIANLEILSRSEHMKFHSNERRRNHEGKFI
jgi:hypothetical protein